MVAEAAALPSVRRLSVGTATIDVSLPAEGFERGPEPVLAWIARAAQAVAGYYGRFPVEHVRIELRGTPGRRIRHGRALVRQSPLIVMSVGREVGEPQFASDWRMTHEMVHLAFPNLPDRHHWLEEGLATYVEPIARARVGWLSEDEVWSEWLGNMPRGLPRPGDRGLDHTPTWARTYWGGALFCLVADVEIRRQTAGRAGLSSVLRAVLQRGGNLRRTWPVSRVLELGEQTLQRPILEEIYRRLALAPTAVDLDALWADLGVGVSAGVVRYDDDAPLAAIRRELVTGESRSRKDARRASQ